MHVLGTRLRAHCHSVLSLVSRCLLIPLVAYTNCPILVAPVPATGLGPITAEWRNENITFYYKMMGDYYRIIVEVEQLPYQNNNGSSISKPLNVGTGMAFAHCQEAMGLVLACYEKAQETANSLPAVHSTVLALSYNFAVFCHDVAKSPEKVYAQLFLITKVITCLE